MSNFEKIAASPEVLGAFLDSLNVATGPWDESFHNAFCDSCGRETCDAGHCPHEKERNNPTWWLTLAAAEEQDASRAVWRNDRVELEPGIIVISKKEKLFEEIKAKILELDVQLEDAINVMEIVKIACINAIKKHKKASVSVAGCGDRDYSSEETTIVGG